VSRILEVGTCSSKSELQDIALNISDLSRKFQFSLQSQWVSRNDNVIADQLSRVFDYDDWAVLSRIFPHSCDVFADHKNFKVSFFLLKIFMSKFPLRAVTFSWWGDCVPQ